MEKQYSGYIRKDELGFLCLNAENAATDPTHKKSHPIASLFQDDWNKGDRVYVQIFTSKVKWNIDENFENFLYHSFAGVLEVSYFSHDTGNPQLLKIGGNDLIFDLSKNEGEYCYILVINIQSTYEEHD